MLLPLSRILRSILMQTLLLNAKLENHGEISPLTCDKFKMQKVIRKELTIIDILTIVIFLI